MNVDIKNKKYAIRKYDSLENNYTYLRTLGTKLIVKLHIVCLKISKFHQNIITNTKDKIIMFFCVQEKYLVLFQIFAE